MRKLRVLHAPDEIAGQQRVLAEAMRGLGVKAKSVNFHPNQFGNKADYNLNLSTVRFNPLDYLKRIVFFIFAVFNFDVFQFNYARSLLPRYLDLPILKMLGKKVVFVYHGCDIRDCAGYFKRYGIENTNHVKADIGFGEKLKVLKTLEKYADAFAVTTVDLLSINKSFIYMPIAVNLKELSGGQEKRNRTIKIVHSPTDREVKGTQFVISSLEELKKRGYPVELVLLEGLSAARVKEIFKEADIVIDQVLSGWYGTVSIEGMAAGKPVVVNIFEEYKSYMPDLPVVTASRETITRVLADLIKHRDSWLGLGKKGREFVEKHHSSEVVAAKYLALYKSL